MSVLSGTPSEQASSSRLSQKTQPYKHPACISVPVTVLQHAGDTSAVGQQGVTAMVTVRDCLDGGRLHHHCRGTHRYTLQLHL
jgi:hypothetical protein